MLSSRDTEKLCDFYKSVQAHVRSLSHVGINSARYGIIVTPIIIHRLPPQLELKLTEISNGKECDLQNLLSFFQASVAPRQRALCYSTDSGSSVGSGSSSCYRLDHCLSILCALLLLNIFLNDTVAKRRQAVYNYGTCFGSNQLSQNCPTKK